MCLEILGIGTSRLIEIAQNNQKRLSILINFSDSVLQDDVKLFAKIVKNRIPTRVKVKIISIPRAI